MTFLKSVLGVLMLSVAISAAIIICADKKEEAPPMTEYILRYENGQVSLFENGEQSESFEGISFDELPFVDRQNLMAGIRKNSYEEILSLVEDFDG